MEEESSGLQSPNDSLNGTESDDAEYTWWKAHQMLIWSGILLILFVVTTISNLMNIITVIRHRDLHSGYFLVHLFFSTIHIIYFLISLVYRVKVVLEELHILDRLLPDESISSMLDIVDDLSQCLLGLEMWLLSTLAIDCCLTLSMKHRAQGWIRALLTFISFLMTSGAFAVMCLLRFTDFLSTGHPIDDYQWPSIIRCSIELLLFITVPMFIIVIVGVMNCVTQHNSTRQHPIATDMAIRLDIHHSITGATLLLVWMAERILTLAVELEAHKNEEMMMSLSVSRFSLGVAISLLASVFPLSALFIFGKMVCCCSRKT